MDLVKLSEQIAEYFNGEELADLCFRLGIAYENLPGTMHAARVRELVEYCRRHGRQSELIAACRQLRPHATWPEPGATLPQPPNSESFGGPPVASTTSNVPGALPSGTLPPQVPGMFWMPYPNTWYGPFYGFFIGWMSFGGFQVWHPFYGAIPYPDPFGQLQRNTWVRLFNSPFNVYVDGGPSGYVFAQYSPI